MAAAPPIAFTPAVPPAPATPFTPTAPPTAFTPAAPPPPSPDVGATELPPERDPLAGLQNHPLFSLPGATPLRPAANGTDPASASQVALLQQQVAQLTAELTATRQALEVLRTEFKQVSERTAELERQLDATEADKRRLLRQLDDLRRREPPASQPEPDPARWEALFSGELPSAKATLNDLPLELKAFLATTKAQLRAETGVTVTERDQVILALAAYRLVMQACPDVVRELQSLRHKDANSRVSAFAAWVLAWLEARLRR